MNKLFKTCILLLFSNMVLFSQTNKSEDTYISKTLNKLFVKAKINSSGNLCVSLQYKFLTLIDNAKEPMIINPNEIYCVKDSIKIIDKHFHLILFRNKNNYWNVKLNNRPPYDEIEQYEGVIEVKNDSIIDVPMERNKP